MQGQPSQGSGMQQQQQQSQMQHQQHQQQYPMASMVQPQGQPPANGMMGQGAPVIAGNGSGNGNSQAYSPLQAQQQQQHGQQGQPQMQQAMAGSPPQQQGGQGGMPAGLDREKLAAMNQVRTLCPDTNALSACTCKQLTHELYRLHSRCFQRMNQLRAQGFTEQTSPELANIMRTFAAIQQQMHRMKTLYNMQQSQAQAQAQTQAQAQSPPSASQQQSESAVSRCL